MKNCENKIKQTCGTKSYSTCVDWEGSVNTQSNLVDENCLNQEEVDQDQYDQLEDIWNEIDLSELGDKCLEYITDENDKIVVKNVLLKFEQEICDLKEKIETIESRQLCDMLIGDCLDLTCITEDACGNPIITVGQLLQVLINKNC